MIYEHDTEFLDLETSGLIPSKMVPGKRVGTMKKAQADYNEDWREFPFIVSMAWAKNDGECKHYILNPEGREIPKEASDIHGITTEIANQSNKYFWHVVIEFMTDAMSSEIVVGHGLYFDTSIVKANILREIDAGRLQPITFEDITEILHKDKRIDTMKSTIKMMKKWPTLSELHQKIFHKGFDPHDAKEDLRATRRCYEWLVKKGIVPTFEKLQEKAQERNEAAVNG